MYATLCVACGLFLILLTRLPDIRSLILPGLACGLAMPAFLTLFEQAGISAWLAVPFAFVPLFLVCLLIHIIFRARREEGKVWYAVCLFLPAFFLAKFLILALFLPCPPDIEAAYQKAVAYDPARRASEKSRVRTSDGYTFASTIRATLLLTPENQRIVRDALDKEAAK